MGQRSRIRKRRAHKRKGRKNPAFGTLVPFGQGQAFADPIFLHHVAGAILRMLELYPPNGKGFGGFGPAEFIKPVDVEDKGGPIQ